MVTSTQTVDVRHLLGLRSAVTSLRATLSQAGIEAAVGYGTSVSRLIALASAQAATIEDHLSAIEGRTS